MTTPPAPFTHLAHTERSLDEFFRWPERKILMFKGPWGAGKSYFLRKHYLSKRIPWGSNGSNLPEYISYSSVFGCKSIQEVESRIISSCEKSVNWGLKGPSHVKALKELVRSALGKMELSYMGVRVPIPLTSLIPAVTRSKPMLIVLDDIERSSSGLMLADILGLISSLAENTNEEFKAILVCNEAQLNDDNKQALATYREKVLHSEIFYNPSPEELVVTFFNHPEERAVMQECLSTIKETNIRIIQRTSTALTEISKLFRDQGVELLPDDRAMIVRLTVFFYRAGVHITREWSADYAAKRGSIFSNTEKKTESKEGELFNALRAGWSEIEPVVLDWLNNGFVAESILEDIVLKLKNNNFRQEFYNDSEAAYASFENNFSISDVDIVTGPIKKLLDKYAKKVSLGMVLRHTHFLELFGIDCTPWIDEHVKAFGHQLTRQQKIEYIAALASRPARDYIVSLRHTEERNVAELVTQIVTKQSWNPGMTESLALATEDEYEAWLTAKEPDDTLSTLRSFLQLFKDSEDPMAVRATQTIRKVLRRMASNSDVNRIRMLKFFDWKTDELAEIPEV